MSQWESMFSISMGIAPDRLVELSVPQMVDHVRYLKSLNSEG